MNPSVLSHWKDPEDFPALGTGAVHIWRVRLEELFPRLAELHAYLDESEKQRAGRFKFESGRTQYTAARGALRNLLGRYVRMDPCAIPIGTGERGKPFLSKSLNMQEITFNVSHSGEICLIAVSQSRRIGIDVEKIRMDVDFANLAERYFARAEFEALCSLALEVRPLGFFLAWTRKEAYVKAHGDGLHLPLDQFEVTLDPEGSAALTSVDTDQWELHSLTPDNTYAAALVVEKPVASINLWNFNALWL